MTNNTIVETSKFLEELETKYGKIRRITGKIGYWFSRNRKMFFDYEEQNKEAYLEQLYLTPNLGLLIIYFIVKGKDGYQLRDSRFKNIYGQTFQRMVDHFHTVLEPSVRHGLQVGGLTYLECIGYGAVIEETVAPTISSITEIKNIIEEETETKYEIVTGKDESETIMKILETKSSIIIDNVKIIGNILTLSAPKDLTVKQPLQESGLEWDQYLKNALWKDASTLTIREKYYGVLLVFDTKSASFKVELTYPVEETKLRKACKALKESKAL